MIDAVPVFHFCDCDLPLLKASAELHLRHISPALRMEILARCCGFQTYASMRCGLASAAGSELLFSLDIEGAADFARQRRIEFEPGLIYDVLATAAVPKVVRENPLLHDWGHGRGCLEPDPRRRRELVEGLPVERRRGAIEREINKDLKERRVGFQQIRRQAGFLRALSYVSRVEKTKTVNRRQSSYGLKHAAERIAYSLEGGVELRSSYVSNSELIAAAIFAGFTLHQPEVVGGCPNSSPNPEFNMSQRSINRLSEEGKVPRFAS